MFLHLLTYTQKIITDDNLIESNAIVSVSTINPMHRCFRPATRESEMNVHTQNTAIINPTNKVFEEFCSEKFCTILNSCNFHIKVQEITKCARISTGRSELTVCEMNHTGERRSRAADGGCRCGNKTRFYALCVEEEEGGRGRGGSGE